MIIRVEYETQEEYDSLLQQHSNMPFVKVENLFEGNFLTFSDEPLHKEIIYTQVDAEDYNNLKTQVSSIKYELMMNGVL